MEVIYLYTEITIFVVKTFEISNDKFSKRCHESTIFHVHSINAASNHRNHNIAQRISRRGIISTAFSYGDRTLSNYFMLIMR